MPCFVSALNYVRPCIVSCPEPICTPTSLICLLLYLQSTYAKRCEATLNKNYEDKTSFLSSDIISRCMIVGIKMNAVWITTRFLYETALGSLPVNSDYIDALTDYDVVVYVCLNLIYVLYGLFLCDVVY